MKQTLEDEAFAVGFGQELRQHYERSTQAGAGGGALSDEAFAATLNVTRPALKKYLAGAATPSISVIVLAYERYGINVPYAGTPLFNKKSRLKRNAPGGTQLVLPFSVQSFGSTSVHAKIEPRGENRFALMVDIGRAAG
jgi:hypothetical protein